VGKTSPPQEKKEGRVLGFRGERNTGKRGGSVMAGKKRAEGALPIPRSYKIHWGPIDKRDL